MAPFLTPPVPDEEQERQQGPEEADGVRREQIGPVQHERRIRQPESEGCQADFPVEELLTDPGQDQGTQDGEQGSDPEHERLPDGEEQPVNQQRPGEVLRNDETVDLCSIARGECEGQIPGKLVVVPQRVSEAFAGREPLGQ